MVCIISNMKVLPMKTNILWSRLGGRGERNRNPDEGRWDSVMGSLDGDKEDKEEKEDEEADTRRIRGCGGGFAGSGALEPV